MIDLLDRTSGSSDLPSSFSLVFCLPIYFTLHLETPLGKISILTKTSQATKNHIAAAIVIAVEMVSTEQVCLP